MRGIDDVMDRSPVVPVVTLPPKVEVLSLAEALLEGGVGIIEITLRTPGALAAIEAVGKELPAMWVGAGTVWDAAAARDAVTAGSRFLVSPGIAEGVHEVATEAGVALLPGAQTASEVQHWRARGLTAVKFFPAEPAGGIAALKALASVFPELRFCPTGGISEATAPGYLALRQVPCVGGSWLTPASLLERGSWGQVTRLARRAVELATAG